MEGSKIWDENEDSGRIKILIMYQNLFRLTSRLTGGPRVLTGERGEKTRHGFKMDDDDDALGD